MDAEYQILVEKCLRSLGGDRQYVPGAKLLQAVQRRALDDGLDFRKFLSGSGLKFSAYLENLDPKIRVRKRGAADMLIGLESAQFEVPQNESGHDFQFRKDVYRAFGKPNRVAFFYDAANDLFTGEQSNAAILIPPTTRDASLLERNHFADTVEKEQGDVLRGALKTAHPFAEFRDAIRRLNLSDAWYAYRNRQIRTAVETWASDNKIQIRDAWFRPAPELNLRAVLIGLANLMSDEEIRTLNVPLRVVEALLLKKS